MIFYLLITLTTVKNETQNETKTNQPPYSILEGRINTSIRLIIKTLIMAITKKSISEAIKNRIKIRLDHKTIITLKDMTKFDYWKNLYPNAVVIS